MSNSGGMANSGGGPSSGAPASVAPYDGGGYSGGANSGGGPSSGAPASVAPYSGGNSGGYSGVAPSSTGMSGGQPPGTSGNPDDMQGESSEGLMTPGAPYGSGAMGFGGPPTGTPPGNAQTGPSPGDMAAQYGNSGGKNNFSGTGSPSAPPLPSLDGSSNGGAGAPMGGPGMGGPGAVGPGGYGGGFPGQASPPPAGPTKPAEDAPYLEKAKYAFSIGREPDAYKFALAHALSGAEDSNVVLDEIQWVKDLLSPNSGITFALGMDLKAPAGISDYRPVGSTDPNGVGGDGERGPGMMGGPGMVGPGMMGGSGMGGAGGPPGRKDDPQTFSKATGEMGRTFIRMFEERFMEGKFGKLFTDVENATGSSSASLAVGNNGMEDSEGLMGSGMAGGLAGIAPPGGMMAPGMGGPGMGGPGMGAPGAARKPTGIGHRLTPGLSYIGTGTLGELKTKATKDGFDCLIVFDVQVEQNKRTGRVTNDTRVQVVSLKSGKVIASSKRLNNIEVQKRMEDGQGDGIEQAIQAVFSKVDDLLVLSPLPSLKPEVAQKRISDLINSKQVPTLKALGEVCLFHHLKLIGDDEKTSAFELLLEGADGSTLGTGSVEDKRAVLDKLMPKQ